MRENECFGLRVARRGRWHFPCRYSDRRQPEVPEEDQKHAPCTRGVYFSTRGSRGGAELPAFRAPRLRKLRLSIPCCHMTSKAMKTATPIRGVTGPPLHLIDDPPFPPLVSSCRPLCRAIWSTTPHPSPPRGISIPVWVKKKKEST